MTAFHCDPLFPTEIPAHQPKVNDIIAAAKREYQKRGLPLERLLGDVYDWLKCRNVLSGKNNPWAYLYKGICKLPVEGGRTFAEDAFNLAAAKIKDELPTDIIRELFYRTLDTRVEYTFIFRLFAAQCASSDNIVVVNPCPDFILACHANPTFADKTIRFVVGDEKIAFLYNRQFSQTQFLADPEDAHLEGADFVMLFLRNGTCPTPEDYRVLNRCAEHAIIFTFCPNAHFDSHGQQLHNILDSQNCFALRLLLFPSALISSSPKKRVLCVLKKGNANSRGPREVVLREALYSSDTAQCSIAPESYKLPSNQLWGKRTLTATLTYLKKPRAETEVQRRNRASVYPFSNEIDLRYIIQRETNGTFSGRAYYSEILPEGSNRQSGDRLTPMIEKGLRANTEALVVEKLEELAFDPRVEQVIVKDICLHYRMAMPELSLKTMWFCLREQLLKKPSYQDDLAMELFCGASQSLSKLHPQAATEADYRQSMAAIFNMPWDEIPAKYWDLLNMIFAAITREKWLTSNPINDIRQKLTGRENARQLEVRNNLVKKSFTPAEEKAIVDYLFEEIRTGEGTPQARYTVDPLALAGAIRLFTGMTVRECCVLTWSDFRKIPNLPTYQFIINKIFGEDILSVSERKLRLIPCPSGLADMLLDRQRWCMGNYSGTKEQLASEPILCSYADGKAMPCSPKQVSDFCRKLIGIAGISEQLILLPGENGGLETNLSAYRGDFFQSNFRFRARDLAKLTNGELSYVLGIAPPDTYSDHYCDFTHDGIQHNIALKLQRWVSQRLPAPGGYAPTMQEYTLTAQNKSYAIQPYAGLPCTAGFTIDCSSLLPGQALEIRLDAEHGTKGSVTAYPIGG